MEKLLPRLELAGVHDLLDMGCDVVLEVVKTVAEERVLLFPELGAVEVNDIILE